MINFGFYIIPLTIIIIILCGLVKKVKIFDVFLLGASDGLASTLSIAPSLIGLVVAVSMLKSSGALDIFSAFVSPLCNWLHIPAPVIPLAILRPISGSGSTAFIDSLFKTYGPDSFIGKLASVISGSTETTFYTLAVYFGAVKIKNSRYALPAALVADITAFAVSVITAYWLMS